MSDDGDDEHRPAARPVDRERGAAREGDDAGEAERAVRGQVGLGDQETCADAQQHDAQERPWLSGHRSAARSRDRATVHLDCRHAHRAPAGRGPAAARRRRPRAPARARRRGRAPRAALGRVPGGDHGRARARGGPHRGGRRLAPPGRGLVLLRAPRSRPLRAGHRGSRRGARRPRRGRFGRVAARWRALLADAPGEDSGPVAVGGFAFAPDGGSTPHWAGFEPASLHVPEVALARRGEQVTLTLAAVAAPDDDADALCRPAGRARGLAAQRPAAAARPRPDRALPRGQRDAARALRVRGGAGGRAHPRRGAGQDRPRARGAGPRAARARPGGGARRPARGVPVVLHLLRRARRERVRRRQPRAARAPRRPARRARSRWPARRAAAPTPRSTTTSASSCCAPTRTARSRRSSRGASCARCAR